MRLRRRAEEDVDRRAHAVLTRGARQAHPILLDHEVMIGRSDEHDAATQGLTVFRMTCGWAAEPGQEHGKRGEACAASRIDVDPIEAELRELGSEGDRARSERDLSVVLDLVLAECHPRTKRLLSEASAAISALCATAPSARPLADAFNSRVVRATKQMREEEDTLYARVRLLADARLGRGPYPSPPLRTIH